MTTKAAAKKHLLQVLSSILTMDDTIFPDELDVDDPKEYRPWNAAREELAEEFNRRGGT